MATVPTTLPDRPDLVIIAGLGREGISSWQYLSSRFPNAKYVLSDAKPLDQLDPFWATIVGSGPEGKLSRQDDRSGVSSTTVESKSLPTPPPKAITYLPLDRLSDISGQFTETTLVCKTAGLPTEHQALTPLWEAGAHLTSNTALFFEAISQLPNPPVTIGVTGTKGKSTTAAVIHHVLSQGGIHSVLAGNIGMPPLDVLANLPAITTETALDVSEPADSARPAVLIQPHLATPTPLTHHHSGQPKPIPDPTANKNYPKSVVVVELSSHQLRELTVSPHIAVVLDITPEHLDYYTSWEEYSAAKQPIVAFQTSADLVIGNPTLQKPWELLQSTLASKHYFSLQHFSRAQSGEQVSCECYVEDGKVLYRGQPIIAVAEVPLRGTHNILNILPAVMIAKHFGLGSDTIAQALKTFKSLPHRLEFVATIDGAEYYNDSQATTPEASIAAISSFQQQPIILIAGGSDKGATFKKLAETISQHQVKTIILFPPMGERISQAIQHHYRETTGSLSKVTPADSGQNLPTLVHVDSMSLAVATAQRWVQPGDVVLLSPACASFGIFKNYQDRGDQFKTAVRALAQKTP